MPDDESRKTLEIVDEKSGSMKSDSESTGNERTKRSLRLFNHKK